MMQPKSCDTFVALPPATAGDCVVFGKNSDRPMDEVQEVFNVPAADHTPGSKVKCTYIEIDQALHTYAVVLSRPAWLWGAEMGANEKSVCIGNEAVWTKVTSEDDLHPRLLGMDLVRLGLERGGTAREAVGVVTSLLETHGQGGACYERTQSSYHNSFLICDARDAWVVETAGRHWAAEHVAGGVRNISNQLTIRTRIDLSSAGLRDFAEAQGWWKAAEGKPFDFARAFSDSFEETDLSPGVTPSGRQLCGLKLLRDLSADASFGAKEMLQILRDEDSGICMTGSFQSNGSQVSVLPPSGSQAYHLLTATPDPSVSVFKPFIFCAGAATGDKTLSEAGGLRRHALYTAHMKLSAKLKVADKVAQQTLSRLQELETFCLGDVQEMAAVMAGEDGAAAAANSTGRAASIFSHMAELELNFYSTL